MIVRAWLLFLAFIISGVSFPLMFWERKSFLPNTDKPNVVDAWEQVIVHWDRPFSFTVLAEFSHDAKNLLTELFRGDAQWWSKFSCFSILATFFLMWWL